MSTVLSRCSSKHVLKTAFTGLALLCSVNALAATVTYQATTDFPVIDAGEVPFYVDAPRQALGINAAVVENRNKFAKATVVFDGQPGVYQITLVGIAEVDGEADYRLSVNGEVVGTATNPEVSEEFVTVRHPFGEVNLPAGAVIGVESVANSNGKIPENDEFAFARGRWIALELSDSEETDVNFDLAIDAQLSSEELNVGDELVIDVSLRNTASSEVATGGVVSVSFPSNSLELIDQSVCSSISSIRPETSIIECQLEELPVDSTVELSINLRAVTALSSEPILVSVSSDQTDADGSNNTVGLILSVNGSPSEGDSTENVGPGPDAEEGSSDPDGQGSDNRQEADAAVRASSSGSGALTLFGLCIFGFVSCFVYRIRLK